MATLVAYYSFSGNNEVLAKSLAHRLGCDLLKIETKKKRTSLSILIDLLFKRLPELKSPVNAAVLYDNIIFVAPIWAGKIASPLRSFIKKERRNIHRYSFITICGGQPGQLENIREGLIDQLFYAPTRLEELWISELLKQIKDKKVTASQYKLKDADLEFFDDKIDNFLLATGTSFK